MDTTILVEQDISEGRELIQALVQDGFPLRAAAWFYVAEAGVWRLLLASPIVEEQGPLKAYAWIDAVLAGLNLKIRLHNVMATTPRRDVGRALGSALTDSSSQEGRRISRGVIEGVYIEGAYVYRLPSADRETLAPMPT